MAEIIAMPKLGFDMAEGTLVRWVISEGDKVVKGAILAEIETDKATVEVESPYDGVVVRHIVPQGEVVPVNTPIAVIAAPGEEVDLNALLGETSPAKSKPAPEQAAAAVESPAPAAPIEAGAQLGSIKASPLARRMAQDTGIDLRQVRGSGPGGRITKKDIQAFIASPPPMPVAAPVPVAPLTSGERSVPVTPLSALAAAPVLAEEKAPLNRLRAAIGRRMVEAKQQVPHFYVTHEYDMDAVMELRKQVNALLPEGEKLSVNDFIVKAAALALRQYPNLNASLGGDHVVRHGQVNVGVAVSVEGGLLTVVCREADRKSLRQIAVEVKTMAGRAREGKVRPDDIEGSTFSVSNLGMYDVENFIAIINPPEAAILAVGSARQVAVVKEGQVAVGWRMKATISVDHRISDGVEAAQFMQALAKYLEEPLYLLV
ncbi:MAG: 2-oxo acid dehydrogenase subunit E2 [Anaerolineales bacterium]|nr:2-oxo acid dehydrogenase subunit E2 [Anaerolineales bacterium]